MAIPSMSNVGASRVGAIPHAGSFENIDLAPTPIFIMEHNMPDRLKKAFDYMAQFKIRLPSMVGMCIEAMVAQQVRTAENAEIITECRLATVTEPPAPRENSRVTSKHIHGLPCSATGEESLDMLKAKEDNREA
jgi:hypothetical protein